MYTRPLFGLFKDATTITELHALSAIVLSGDTSESDRSGYDTETNLRREKPKGSMDYAANRKQFPRPPIRWLCASFMLISIVTLGYETVTFLVRNITYIKYTGTIMLPF